MAQRLETITQHVFAFTTEEITAIIEALIETGRHDVAEDIYDELPEGEISEGDCECEPVFEVVGVGDGISIDDILKSIYAAKEGK